MPPAPILACSVHALISPLRLFVCIVLVLNKLHMDPQSADSALQSVLLDYNLTSSGTVTVFKYFH